MKRFVCLCLCVLLCAALALGVSAEDRAVKYQNVTGINAEGECQVSIYLTLKLEEVPRELYFPLPGDARDIRLNGQRVTARRSGETKQVDLLKKKIGTAPGEYSINFQYNLPCVVFWEDEDTLLMRLPLMSGFGHETTNLEFTVTLPGDVGYTPTFSSGYFGESIESYLNFTVRGSTVSGRNTADLKDHETLTMEMRLDPEQFPDIRYHAESGILFSDIAAIVCAVLALGYWLLTLRCAPILGRRHPTPVEGATAGDLGSRLTMTGTDLTMMVLTWAQLGYILIQLDDNGRVLLHRRMNMGNERSAFENRIYDKLFPRKKYMVDGTGYHYAKLFRYVAKQPVKTSGLFRRDSGNPTLFRCVSAGVAAFGGASVALYLIPDGAMSVVLAIVLAAFGGITGWVIQRAMHHLHLREKSYGRLALVLSLVWLILGAWSGAVAMSICMVLSQLLAGLAAGYGGRRSDMGRQTAQEILGLRRYLRTLPREELHRICEYNPDYFFEMLPTAMALGVDKEFARRFGAMELPECTFLTTRMNSAATAWEWLGLFRDAVEALDERQKQLPLEKLMGK